MKTHTPGPWIEMGNGIVNHPVSGAQIVTSRIETSLGFFEVIDSTNEPDGNLKLIAAAPEMLAALELAEKLIYAARRYFPRSIQNSDRFSLENANATINKAIAKAKGQQ